MLSLPWFEKLFNSPAAHRVHHAINPRYLDKNHAATLLVWDRLFGTWEPETEKPVYGITRPLGSFNPVWAQFAGYADLFRLARKAPSLGQAVQLFFRSPAWHPGWMDEKITPPATREAQKKYDVHPSALARGYAVFWFTMLTVATFSVLMWGRGLSTLQLCGVIGAVYFTLVAISGVLEGKRWVRALEPARYAGLAALFLVLVP